MIQNAKAILEKYLGRSITVDPSIPKAILFRRVLALATGLVRGMLLTRRKLVLGPGARVGDLRKLHLDGGLIRLEEYSRIECTSRDGVSLGRNFKLGAHSRIFASGTFTNLGVGVQIGDNVGIGEFSYIGGAGGVRIGSGTIAGQYFSVHPENHLFSDPKLPIRDQGVSRKGIVVGESCWIGAKVTLLDGVVIGPNCVIGAGSVVTKSFPDNSVIGGVPAQRLRDRRSRSQNMDVVGGTEQ